MIYIGINVKIMMGADICLTHYFAVINLLFLPYAGAEPLSNSSHDRPNTTAAVDKNSRSVFHPSSYMTLLSEGATSNGMKIYSERDLGPAMESVIKGVDCVFMKCSSDVSHISLYCRLLMTRWMNQSKLLKQTVEEIWLIFLSNPMGSSLISCHILSLHFFRNE